MIYNHAVKVYGKFYLAGENVPDINSDSSVESTNTIVEEANIEEPEKESKCTRKSKQEKTE